MIPEFQRKSAYNLSNYIAIVLAFLESVRMIGFISFEPNYILLSGLMLIPVIQSFSGSQLFFSRDYLFFCIYLCFNLIITNPPSIFHSWQRLLLFIILLCSVSPMISSDTQRHFRLRCFLFFICFMSILSGLSCICYFLGINYFRNFYGLTDFTTQAGLFGGLFTHSMLLAPMAGISVCFILWNYLRTRKNVLLIFAIMSAGAMLFAASRAALLATVCACLILILLFYKKRSNAIKVITTAVIALSLTLPFWESSLSGIIAKNETNEQIGKYGSRTTKFEARIAEFDNNPIFGVGFAAIDPNGKDEYNVSTGAIEPGSSWLCTLSMTGIIGFTFILHLMFIAFRSAKSSGTVYAPLMSSLIIWFAIHMMFEGYIYASGGPLCFIYWLTVGVATDMKFHPNLEDT